MAEKIVTGDEVIVIRGKDRGARGRVRQNLPREDRVIVEGVNIVKKHQRAIPGVRQAGIIEMEAPIHVQGHAHLPALRKAHAGGFPFHGDGREGALLQEVPAGDRKACSSSANEVKANER